MVLEKRLIKPFTHSLLRFLSVLSSAYNINKCTLIAHNMHPDHTAPFRVLFKSIGIHHECEGRIEKSFPRIRRLAE